MSRDHDCMLKNDSLKLTSDQIQEPSENNLIYSMCYYIMIFFYVISINIFWQILYKRLKSRNQDKQMAKIANFALHKNIQIYSLCYDIERKVQ